MVLQASHQSKSGVYMGGEMMRTQRTKDELGERKTKEEQRMPAEASTRKLALTFVWNACWCRMLLRASQISLQSRMTLKRRCSLSHMRRPILSETAPPVSWCVNGMGWTRHTRRDSQSSHRNAEVDRVSRPSVLTCEAAVRLPM